MPSTSSRATSLHHEDFPNLQQFRWGPERIADTTEEARSRLFVLPGSHFSDPEFSWKHVVPPAAVGFVASRALGPSFMGDMFVGAADLNPNNGVLFRFNLTGNRRKIAVDDPRLEDRVADNVDFHDLTESESLLIGTDFGVVTELSEAVGRQSPKDSPLPMLSRLRAKPLRASLGFWQGRQTCSRSFSFALPRSSIFLM